MSSRPTVAVLVITKNEETHIAECLESVKWADEVILVDAQSTDETVAIAKKYTDHIFVRPWPGFGLQKNFGMEQIGSDWILILDADERVSMELSKEIQETLTMVSGKTVAYRVPRRNYFYGQWVRWGGAYPDYQIRLVQNGKAQYNDVAVHENLLVNGQIATLSRHLDHYTERKITDHFKKFNLYKTLAASEKGKVQNSVSWYHVICNPFIIFFKTYVLKKGYRDGTRGIIFAVFASMYTFVKYTKLFESHVTENNE